MNAWLVATILLLPPFAVPVVVALRGRGNQRLAAVQVASTLAALLVAAMTFAFNQSSFIDIALCVTFLSAPGTFLFAMFMERWL